jgi:hypothetical protein
MFLKDIRNNSLHLPHMDMYYPNSDQHNVAQILTWYTQQMEQKYED